MNRIAISLLLSLLAAVSSACAQTSQQVDNLEKLIAHYKEVEATQNKLMNELSRGTVVMVKFPGTSDFFPITTEEIRSRFTYWEIVVEIEKPNPDFDAALKRGNYLASRNINQRRADSRAYMQTLTGEASKIRTMRQKLERQRDQVSDNKRSGAAAAKGSFGGTWSSGWGKMVLTQSGTHVSGTYEHAQGKIEGNVGADGQLHFKWTQNNGQGIGVFTLSADGKSFTGTWNYTGADGSVGSGGTWSGTKAK